MKRIIKFELKRAFVNRFFLAALVVGIVISVLHIILVVIPASKYLELHSYSKGVYPNSIYNTMLGFDMSSLYLALYTMLIPVLACLPFADSLYTDKKSGYIKYLYSKVEKGWYLLAKLIANFLVAGTVVVFPLLLNLWGTALFVPALIPQASTAQFPIFAYYMWSDLYYTFPMVYITLYGIIIFIYAGIFACIGMMLSTFIKNRFVVLLLPFAIVTVWNFVASQLSGNALAPAAFLRMDQLGGVHLNQMICILLILLACVVALYCYEKRKHEIY
ncbi:MAG: hypothetical protein FWE25_07545 [Lachnospiraceae bacterium]|nr:hypothetical protein [Lachnospiraceae bacterium]